MAEIIERVHQKTTERTDEYVVTSVEGLRTGDVVLSNDNDIHVYPRVRRVNRTVTENVEGSVTLKLTEAEAAIVRAVLGRVNGMGNKELGDAAFSVYCALDDAKLRTDYIKVLASDGTSATLSPQYGQDDRLYA